MMIAILNEKPTVVRVEIEVQDRNWGRGCYYSHICDIEAFVKDLGELLDKHDARRAIE